VRYYLIVKNGVGHFGLTPFFCALIKKSDYFVLQKELVILLAIDNNSHYDKSSRIK
jgi:hypothetical protein|tara:strand:+ start:57770 stop:57937 length:168 start_codon:yes stop_codon:yes gene_type:complete